MVFLSYKLKELMMKGMKEDKQKVEFIVPDATSVEKVKLASKEGKKSAVYQYAILDSVQIEVVK